MPAEISASVSDKTTKITGEAVSEEEEEVINSLSRMTFELTHQVGERWRSVGGVLRRKLRCPQKAIRIHGRPYTSAGPDKGQWFPHHTQLLLLLLLLLRT